MKPTTKEPLSLSGSKRFIHLEEIIKTGKKAFVEVGKALTEIRDSRYYENEFETFEEYCSKRWGFARAHAYRLIDAAEIGVSPIGDKIKTESQARELAKAPQAKRAKVLKMAAVHADLSKRPLTAELIRQAVEAVTKPKPKPEPEPVPEAIRNDRTMREAFGGTVPPVPIDDPIKEALRRHAEESFHKFKVIVSGAVSEIPKNVDSFVFSEWLHGQANLISNRRDQQKNNGAYTR